MCPDRHRYAAQQPLEKDESRLFPNPAAGLVPLGNEAVHPCLHPEECLINTGGFQKDGDFLLVESLDPLLQDLRI